MTALAGGPLQTDVYPISMAFSRDGAWLCVGTVSGKVHRFTRGADGNLTQAGMTDAGPTSRLSRIDVR